MGYAGFWKRFVAVLIDGFILFPIGFGFGFILGFTLAVSGVQDESVIEVMGNILGIVIGWIYFAVMESSPTQGTLGKMALGIKVTDLQGNRIGIGRATGRHFSKFISMIILCVGYIMAGFTARKQALHDMIAGTLIVNK